MKYNEYLAQDGKVIFNIYNFTYGKRMISKDDLSGHLFECTKDKAEEYIQKYKQQQEALQVQEAEKQAEGIITLDNTEDTDPLVRIRQDLVSEMLSNNIFSSKSNIQIIKHE